MRVLQGSFDQHLTVRGQLRVEGSLGKGATVEAGHRLAVVGDLSGPLVVEEGGSATVRGTFTGWIERNDGTVCLHGVIRAPLGPKAGYLHVGVDSVLQDPDVGWRILRRNGALEAVPNGRHGPVGLHINTQELCRYDADSETFCHPSAG